MKSKKQIIAFICAAVILTALCIGSFFLGKQCKANEVKKENELDILFERSDMEGLGTIEGKIT